MDSLANSSDANPEEQGVTINRSRKTLQQTITRTLSRLTGKGGKDRAKVLRQDSDPVDVHNCLNRVLTEQFVPMPDKKRKKRKHDDSGAVDQNFDPVSAASSSFSSSSCSSTDRLWDLGGDGGTSSFTGFSMDIKQPDGEVCGSSGEDGDDSGGNSNSAASHNEPSSSSSSSSSPFPH